MVRRNSEMMVDARKELSGGVGTVELKHIFKTDELASGTRICAELTVPPHCSVGAHVHDGEEEVYFVIQGIATVNDNGVEATLYTGDALYTSNGNSHAIANNTDEVLKVLVIVVAY